MCKKKNYILTDNNNYSKRKTSLKNSVTLLLSPLYIHLPSQALFLPFNHLLQFIFKLQSPISSVLRSWSTTAISLVFLSLYPLNPPYWTPSSSLWQILASSETKILCSPESHKCPTTSLPFSRTLVQSSHVLKPESCQAPMNMTPVEDNREVVIVGWGSTSCTIKGKSSSNSLVNRNQSILEGGFVTTFYLPREVSIWMEDPTLL